MGRKVTDKIRLSFMYSDSWLNSMTIDLKDVDNRLRVRGLDIDENEKAISDSTKGKDYNIERLRKLVDQYWIHHFQDTGAKSSYRTSVWLMIIDSCVQTDPTWHLFFTAFG